MHIQYSMEYFFMQIFEETEEMGKKTSCELGVLQKQHAAVITWKKNIYENLQLLCIIFEAWLCILVVSIIQNTKNITFFCCVNLRFSCDFLMGFMVAVVFSILFKFIAYMNLMNTKSTIEDDLKCEILFWMSVERNEHIQNDQKMPYSVNMRMILSS